MVDIRIICKEGFIHTFQMCGCQMKVLDSARKNMLYSKLNQPAERITRSGKLHIGISFTGKMTSFY